MTVTWNCGMTAEQDFKRRTPLMRSGPLWQMMPPLDTRAVNH